MKRAVSTLAFPSQKSYNGGVSELSSPSMKRAIKIDGKVTVPNFTIEKLLRSVSEDAAGTSRSDPRLWTLGDVGSRSVPDWLRSTLQEALLLLNRAEQQYRFPSPTDNMRREGATVVYGKGSVGSHEDYQMSGLSLLVFLGGHTPDDEAPYGSQLISEGEFYAGGKMTLMRPGDALVFDDRETHSWMANGCWFFLVSPLNKV